MLQQQRAKQFTTLINEQRVALTMNFKIAPNKQIPKRRVEYLLQIIAASFHCFSIESIFYLFMSCILQSIN